MLLIKFLKNPCELHISKTLPITNVIRHSLHYFLNHIVTREIYKKKKKAKQNTEHKNTSFT